jgi:hypothetical protein
MSVVSGFKDITTKEWHAVWASMRDEGDDVANKLLGALLIKDRFDRSRVGLDGQTAEGWGLMHKAALHNCPHCGLRLIEAARKVTTFSIYL